MAQELHSLRSPAPARPLSVLHYPWEPEMTAWLRVIFDPIFDPVAATYRAAMAMPDLRTPERAKHAYLCMEWAAQQGWTGVGSLGIIMSIATQIALRLNTQAPASLDITTQAPETLHLDT